MWGPTPTLGLKTLCTSVFFGVEEGLRSYFAYSSNNSKEMSLGLE